MTIFFFYCVSTIDSDWKTDPFMKISKTHKLPDWFTLPPLDDGSYMMLEDPMIQGDTQIMPP